MKSKISNLMCAVAVGLMALGSSSAMATPYSFSQGGYTGGGVIAGSFDATDIDSNGQISSFAGEVSGFSLSFSGDSIVVDFTHALSDLSGLVYDLGSGFIGDGAVGAVEGMASNWGGLFGFDFASGLGPTAGFGGRVIDISTGATSSTTELIAISTVPEPATSSIVALALVGLGVLRRKTRA